VNLSPARLAVLVALVVGGIAVLLNGFSDTEGTAVAGGSEPAASSSPTVAPSSPTPTPASPTETPKPKVKGVTFMVFNGTSTTGLGATVQQTLEEAGYQASQDAGNALIVPTARTIVYFRGGADADQAKSDATNMAKEFLNDADVRPLGQDYIDEVPNDTELVIIVGEDHPDAGA
jgi:hypothetical protein